MVAAPLTRQQVGEGPAPGQRPDHQGCQHCQIDGHQGKGCDAGQAGCQRIWLGAPAIEPGVLADSRVAPLQQPQTGEQQQVDGEQQEGAAGGGAAPVKVWILIPEPEPHGQRGRGIGPQQQSEIHHSHSVRGHRIEGQAQGGPERRQQQAPPDLRGTETQAGAKPLLAGQLGGFLRCQCHQQQERGLFEDQRQDKTKPDRVFDGLPVRGQLKTGQGGRDEPQQPAGGGEQEGKTDGKGDMGQRQQGGEQTAQQPKAAALFPVLDAVCQQQGGQQQAAQGGGRRNPEAQGCRVPEPRLGQQPLNMRAECPLCHQQPQPSQQGGGQQEGAEEGKHGAPAEGAADGVAESCRHQ